MAHLVKFMQGFCILVIATVFHPENKEEWIYGKTMDWDLHLPSVIF